MKNNLYTVITYDFFYNEDGTPWFCSYFVTIMNEDFQTIHNELIQIESACEFERLRKNAIEQDFKKDQEYINPLSKVHSETFWKIFLAE